ncbi:MAG: hypothetical protein CMK02_00360 [Polycyclovorans sp.]|jgi:2-keto-4-pentenoate hydratase/2-oxohepta-3-ene-1,7-dioic acid hydratase in catechol pathway|uniref:fumarylacetoacetate hydrolase family protein n=1 Tax=Hwanghaeella sp. 1Z406 TaxID=3402811 RepID=UPI000C3CC107|nr:hypothetical protein [Rhodospirillales bacterium]MAY24752.1 hypothetical protein [Polycyclovorans sp.]|tara:strand:- start:27028 stop:27924 length:897 start_codon:yes stop_codon:yes gene_type:complete
MKLVSYDYKGSVQIGLLLGDDQVLNVAQILSAAGLGSDAGMIDLIEQGDGVLDKLYAFEADHAGQKTLALSDVTLLSPIARPRKNVFCVGRNYLEHVSEASEARGREMKIPTDPQYFTKPPTTVIGPFDDIPLHSDVTDNLDYEVELGVIIGKKGVNIPKSDVLDYIYGYTVINDITARDVQRRHDQWFKGKGLDGSCPMGPWIVPSREISDPGALDISLTVNGEMRQNSNTRNMIFDLATLVSVLSQGMTLEPGDIIATGTPSGVGFAMKPPCLLKDGDIVEASVAGVGTIRNRVSG